MAEQTEPDVRTNAFQDEQERAVGITTFISPDAPAFSCVFKQRYTDFQVNEIALSGDVLHLKELVFGQSRKEKKAEAANVAENGIESATEGKKRSAVDEEDLTSTKRVKIEDQASEQKESGDQNGVDLAAVNAAIAELDEQGLAKLREIFGQSVADKVVDLYTFVLKHPNRKPRDHATIKSDIIESKATRTQAHGIVRTLFQSRLETATLQDEPGRMSIRAGSPKGQQVNGKSSAKKGGPNQRSRLDWNELGGEYLHFTLYKENKDTMEVLYFMASELKVKVANFQFAGTKDRRGVTVQRVAAYRVQKDRLIGLTRIAKGWRIGDFEYRKHGMQLGDLKGNEFVITLRDVVVPAVSGIEPARSAIQQAADALANRGFINYYGLQRFGAFKTGTHVTGMRMIQGDLEGAVNGILAYDEALLAEDVGKHASTKIPQDDIDRAKAIHIWRTKNDINRAKQLMPRRFQAESNIMQGLSRKQDGQHRHDRDWQGALMTIQRSLRLMYVHAYQSFVWNTVAAERWRLYQDNVVAGDLVVIGEKDTEAAAQAVDTIDQDGEVVVHASESADPDELTEDSFTKARPLSKEEADSGKFNIYDVVLPLPGWDMLYPANEVGTFYKTFMASDEGGKLDPHDMRRAWKDVSLSGGYRKMVSRPLNGITVDVQPYSGEQQLAPTDLDRLKDISLQTEAQVDGSEQKLAAVMRFQLGSSQYATMALRELTNGGAKAYTPEFATAR